MLGFHLNDCHTFFKTGNILELWLDNDLSCPIDEATFSILSNIEEAFGIILMCHVIHSITICTIAQS